MEGKGEEPSVSSADRPECAVCLQPCVQPVQLPCHHIFCYLCVKGVTHRNKKCAMCRQEIPANYLDNPVLVQTAPTNTVSEDDYQWFYEGKNGWWQYDERTSNEIESAYQKGENQCEVLIAGFLYVIDFNEGHQYRKCDPSRKRRVKRDLSSIPKKGIAGIRIVDEHSGAHGSDTAKTDVKSSINQRGDLSSEAENVSDSIASSNAVATCDSEHVSDAIDVNTPENHGRTTRESDSFKQTSNDTCSSSRKK